MEQTRVKDGHIELVQGSNYTSEAEQGEQLVLGMFYWLRVQCFFSIKLYI